MYISIKDYQNAFPLLIDCIKENPSNLADLIDTYRIAEKIGTPQERKELGNQRRHRVNEHRVSDADGVHQTILEARLNDAEEHAQHQRDRQRDQAQLHGHAELVADDLQHGLALLDAAGFAQIEGEVEV